MTIESLTSLDGFLHTCERLASKSCPLCMSLFQWGFTADKPIRLKISQHTNQRIYSDTGFPEWALMLKSESEIWDVMKLVATQEGRYQDASDRTMLLNHPQEIPPQFSMVFGR